MIESPPSKYHPVQVSLHWLVVTLLIALFIIGKSSAGLANDNPEKLMYLRLHMILGITTLIALITRFILRLRLPKPAPATTGNKFLDMVGKLTHYALYVIVALMVVSGMSLSLRSGLPSILFGGSGAPLPVDFFVFNARILHGFVSKALFALASLHIGAALYHQFLLKDNLLARMWYGKNS